MIVYLQAYWLLRRMTRQLAELVRCLFISVPNVCATQLAQALMHVNSILQWQVYNIIWVYKIIGLHVCNIKKLLNLV